MQNCIRLAAFAAMFSLPLASHAADETKKKGGAFGAADKDASGRVSEAEYVSAVADRFDAGAARARFVEFDKNKDGQLTRTEFNASVRQPKTPKPEKSVEAAVKKKPAARSSGQ